MDPNEAMGSEPIHDTPIPETPNQQEPVSQNSNSDPASGSYRGAGVGQKESPYASSPYYTAHQTRQPDYSGPAWEPGANQTRQASDQGQNQYQYQSPYQAPPKPPKQKKPRKKMGGKGKAVIAAVLAVVLVAGSCGVTAALVNNHWENKVDALESQVQAQFVDLQEQLGNVSAVNSGTSVSGSPVASDGSLTPSQVYAMNVNSVVAISNYATVTSSGYGYFGGSGSQQLVSTGSGFILSEDGYVITNYHVAEAAEKLTITTYAGDEYEAQLIGYDELNDIALLKVDATGLDAVEIGSSDDMIIGDMVVAIGNPLGELTSTQTVGYISGKDRAVSTDGTIINMLQTDAAINSGNSGGPLFNMKGQVVGITTAKYSGSSSSGATIEGIGFAIPIDDVMSMIDDLREYGYVKNQAYLGVTVRDIDSSTASMYSLPSGSYVETVVEGGSADRAGVEPKDIIIAVGEYDVGGNSELTSALRKFKAGDTTTITVYRSGQEVVLDITFDEKPQDLTAESTDPTVSGEMPNNGSYEEWYKYFFGNGQG